MLAMKDYVRLFQSFESSLTNCLSWQQLWLILGTSRYPDVHSATLYLASSIQIPWVETFFCLLLASVCVWLNPNLTL